MAIAITQAKNFVGGEWLDAVEGGEMDVRAPATADVVAQVPSGSAADVDRAVAAASKAFAGVARNDTRRALGRCCSSWPTRSRGNAEELAQLEALNWASRSRSRGRSRPFMVDNLRFYAGGGADREAQGDQRIRARLHVVDPARAARYRGLIAPWNYPLMMGIWKSAPRLPRATLRAQARRADAAHDPPFGRDCGRRSSRAGVLQRGYRGRGPVGERLARHPDVGFVSLTGGRSDRPGGRPAATGKPQAGAPRAGRQGAGDRVRRRGRGGVGEERQEHRLLELRSGVCRRVPGARRAESTTGCSRRSCRTSSR